MCRPLRAKGRLLHHAALPPNGAVRQSRKRHSDRGAAAFLPWPRGDWWRWPALHDSRAGSRRAYTGWAETTRHGMRTAERTIRWIPRGLKAHELPRGSAKPNHGMLSSLKKSVSLQISADDVQPRQGLNSCQKRWLYFLCRLTARCPPQMQKVQK
jgi:hypothetical protein